MFVPAFAFAWWLASLQPTQVVARPQTSADVDDQETSDDNTPSPADPGEPAQGEWDGERVKPKIVTPTLVRAAQGFLDLPMGDERFLAVDGHRYVFVLEQHYHSARFRRRPERLAQGGYRLRDSRPYERREILLPPELGDEVVVVIPAIRIGKAQSPHFPS